MTVQKAILIPTYDKGVYYEMWQKQLKDENETTANNSEVNSTVGEASDAKPAKAEEEVVHKPNESDAEVIPGKTYAQAATAALEAAAPTPVSESYAADEPESPYTPDDSPESPNEAPSTPEEADITTQAASDAEDINVEGSAASPAGQASKSKKKKKQKGKKNWKLINYFVWSL